LRTIVAAGIKGVDGSRVGGACWLIALVGEKQREVLCLLVALEREKGKGLLVD
jgi:hypothetical protein